MTTENEFHISFMMKRFTAYFLRFGLQDKLLIIATLKAEKSYSKQNYICRLYLSNVELRDVMNETNTQKIDKIFGPCKSFSLFCKKNNNFFFK